MKAILVALIALVPCGASAQSQHRVTNRSSPAPEPGAEQELIPSLIDGLHFADEWRTIRRPQLMVKKTLIRLPRLISFPAEQPVDADSRPSRQDSDRHPKHQRVEPVRALGRALYQNMVPEMKAVLETGRPVRVTQKPGWVSVLAPASDSLGDIVAVVEVASQRQLDPHENIK